MHANESVHPVDSPLLDQAANQNTSPIALTLKPPSHLDVDKNRSYKCSVHSRAAKTGFHLVPQSPIPISVAELLAAPKWAPLHVPIWERGAGRGGGGCSRERNDKCN